MAYLFGKRFNDGVKEFGNSLFGAVDIPYKIGNVLTKNVSGKKAAAVSLAALAGCTSVDPRRTSMQNACNAYDIPMFINDKLTPTASDDEVEALLNLDKVRNIEKAVEDYRDPQSRLTERQREILGEGATDIDVYLAAYNKLGSIDRKNKALKEISHDALRQKLGLEKGVESAVEQSRRKIMNYALSSACEIIYNHLVSSEYFFGNPSLNKRYEELQGLFNKFKGKRKEEIIHYALHIKEQKKMGIFDANLADRVASELIKFPLIPWAFAKGVYKGIPLVGQEDVVGSMLTFRPGTAYENIAKSFDDKSIVLGSFEVGGKLIAVILPVSNELVEEEHEAKAEKKVRKRTGGREY